MQQNELIQTNKMNNDFSYNTIRQLFLTRILIMRNDIKNYD